jgi:hypothetical protein
MTADEQHPGMDRYWPVIKETATTLGASGGVLAIVQWADAYSVAMKLFQLVLLVATCVFTLFRAVKAYYDLKDRPVKIPRILRRRENPGGKSASPPIEDDYDGL